jgi:hypothetical protein
MQFVRRGPDIPERLLQAHEEGRVVFFCGAGISYPARLPDFSGLVKRLYQALSVTPNPVQQSAINAKQFDTAIGLLESDVVGGRGKVRSELATILTPNLAVPNATATHEAMLTLAQNRKGCTRLITTNFDRLFEEVRAAKSLSFPDFKAPLLPVPKSSWDGLIYLHGLLPVTPTASELNRLVVSSGDFGRAYLTERWAARFVSELFRNFTVCFVGYSINDPVLRYMMDALAADRLLGESPPEMFAFGSYSKGKEGDRANEWKAKNVTPILYREQQHHVYLHKTLRAWAKTYHDGVRGKEQIVVQSARFRPLASTKQDDFVGRMLWALSDLGGLPAKRFAELDPVPSLDWLESLSQELYHHADLGRYGVQAHAAVDDKLTYSLTSRPTPYPRAPWMAIADAGHRRSQWDDVMGHLARWLIRHLDDPKLLIWLIKRGGQLHDQLIFLIERRLDELDKFTSSKNTTELDRIRANAPNAIPRPAMRTLWCLLLNGHVKSGLRDLSLYRWRDQFKHYGLTASVRLALRETLTPCLSLREPFGWSGEDDDAQDCIRSLVVWEVVLASDHVHSGLRDLPKNEQWTAALPELLDDFSTLLRDALDLMCQLGGVNSENDHSYVHQPSISDHSQNKGFHDWTALIELARDAWLATAAKSPERARIVAETWASGRYPVFRRLALFAATQGRVVPLRQALDWLLADERRLLWSEETRRETMRLLVSLALQLDAAMWTELEQAILSGPPRDLYRADIELDAWNSVVDHGVWLRLAKATQAGAPLSDAGRARLDSISAQYPWQLAADESDEFRNWTVGGWVGDRDPWKPFTPVPRTRRGVLDYLLAHPVLDESQQDDWRKLCSEMFQATAYALCKLAQQNDWPVERWRDALQAWAEEKLRDRSWHFMAPVVVGAPDDLVQVLSHGVGWWLQAVAKTHEGHEDHFLTLAQRIFRLNFFEDDGDADDPVLRAINHPVGHVTQALLDVWYRKEPDDGQGLPQSIKPIFTELCDVQVPKFRHGRVLLAAHALSLFRVDQAWSEQHLLPLLDWNRSEAEARATWEGFLWSPRLYRPLMEAIKPAFLETANHYAQLGNHKEQFAAFLTFAALDPGDTFTTAQLATAIRALPADGLRESAQVLVRALEGAGDQREDYWKNRVSPFWEKIWPKSNDQASSANAESLARLCIAAGNEFPSAVAAVVNWLRVVQHPGYVIQRLQESGLAARFADDALRLLSTIVGDQPSWLPPELRQCLDAIGQAAPNLRQDHRCMRLDELARRFGV